VERLVCFVSLRLIKLNLLDFRNCKARIAGHEIVSLFILCLLSSAGRLVVMVKNTPMAGVVSRLGRNRVWWLLRVRYDGMVRLDGRMGSRKIHTLAVRVADCAGAVFPPVVSLLFLPCIYFPSHSPFLLFLLAVPFTEYLSVNVIMGEIGGGGVRGSLKPLPFEVYIVFLQHLDCYDEIKTHLVSCAVVVRLYYPALCIMLSSASEYTFRLFSFEQSLFRLIL
jgi:hypothetical protein